MRIETSSIIKQYVINERVTEVSYTNKLNGKTFVVSNPNEFIVGFNMKKFFTKIEYIRMQDCHFDRECDNVLYYHYKDLLSREWRFELSHTIVGDAISACLTAKCADESVVIDSVDYFSYPVDTNKFYWSRNVSTVAVHIPAYWASLGQPVYYDGFFCGVEFPTADNQIDNNTISCKIYRGIEIGSSKTYRAHSAVFGAAIADNLEGSKKSFFDYVAAFARPKRFRIQYNSWYDNMLDINNDNLEKSFRAVHKGFKNSGLRDIDCYVVDDGWVDYKKSEFWAFNNKFPNGFNEISNIVIKDFNSEFGIWFGPRGGYSEAFSYAKKLAKIGYPVSVKSMDICAANPNYIDKLTDKMVDFVNDYQAAYYKIDGFCSCACRNKNHGHPVGGYKDLYFYTFVWEQWYKGLEKVRKARENIFLNITSYSNLSAWALRWADSVWMNNASDMYYDGEGDNLSQCLNYRDDRYNNLFNERQYQFPNAYIYNHEPCYATRNYNPPLPNKSHKTVRYSDEQFRQYLMMCMMRGTGFIELYYSPEMLDEGDKWRVNAEVLKWAEDNFDTLSNSIYFGGFPIKGDVYGYIAGGNNDCIVAIRNPKSTEQSYTLDTAKYTHKSTDFDCELVLGNIDNMTKECHNLSFKLKPFEIVIMKLNYKA